MSWPREWNLRFECDISRTPYEVIETVRGHVEEMGRALLQIDAASPFWTSLRESGMSIDAEGWRFVFRVDRIGATCVAVEPIVKV